MANGATLVRNTRQNSGQAPGGPTKPVSLGLITFRLAVMEVSPPPLPMVLTSRITTPTIMMIPKTTSIMVIDLYPPSTRYTAVNSPMKTRASV